MGQYTHSGLVTDLDFSPDGRRLAVVTAREVLFMRPQHRGSVSWRWRIGYSSVSLEYLPDSRSVAVGGDDGSVKIFRLPDDLSN